MNKQVKDLTVAEQDSFCAKQLKSSKSAKRACGECPLLCALHPDNAEESRSPNDESHRRKNDRNQGE